jgi:multiple sugar transport system permease protein
MCARGPNGVSGYARSIGESGPSRARRWLRKIGFWLSVFVIVSPAILVFLWMLSLSLKTEIDNIAYPPVFIPSPPTLNNFLQVFEQNSIGRYLWNSIVVSGGATLIALLIGVPAGFGIARAGAHRLTIVILIARMTPALSYLIPLFTVFQFLGLNNTLTALVITHLVITVPIIVYIMAGYFETLPKELEEAALIDGGSVWTTFRYVALPLARPGIVVGTILAFIFSWNNFVFRRRACRPRDAHAAGGCLQCPDVRTTRVGAVGRRSDHRHVAGIAADDRDPEGDRGRADARRA